MQGVWKEISGMEWVESALVIAKKTGKQWKRKGRILVKHAIVMQETDH